MKVASTYELIEKLQAYEEENGIGAIIGIGTYCAGDRENQYEIEIANDSIRNRISVANGSYKETKIYISAISDDELFPDRRENTDYNLPAAKTSFDKFKQEMIEELGEKESL